MSDKNFMGVIAIIIVAIIGSVIAFGGGNSSAGGFIGDPLQIQTGEATGETDENGEPVAVQRADPLLGTGESKITFIEYADFGCAACGAFYPQLKQVEANYGDQIDVVFRHNPLSTLHPNAFAAHRASVAAGNQDMFWEMHDILFERQPSWVATSGLTVQDAASLFRTYAEELGLDMDQYEIDVASQETFDYIDSHLDSGAQLDVSGTPTIFINGEVVQLRSAAEIIQYIDEILAEEETTDSEDASEESNEEESTPTEEQ